MDLLCIDLYQTNYTINNNNYESKIEKCYEIAFNLNTIQFKQKVKLNKRKLK